MGCEHRGQATAAAIEAGRATTASGGGAAELLDEEPPCWTKGPAMTERPWGGDSPGRPPC
eukprot:962198-Alexandrium_andersonii.AAC.1